MMFVGRGAFGYNPPPRVSTHGCLELGQAIDETHETIFVIRPDRAVFAGGAVALLAGCGTTKWSDSPRTATEQLLISDAVDRAISEIDFSALANKRRLSRHAVHHHRAGPELCDQHVAPAHAGQRLHHQGQAGRRDLRRRSAHRLGGHQSARSAVRRSVDHACPRWACCRPARPRFRKSRWSSAPINRAFARLPCCLRPHVGPPGVAVGQSQNRQPRQGYLGDGRRPVPTRHDLRRNRLCRRTFDVPLVDDEQAAGQTWRWRAKSVSLPTAQDAPPAAERGAERGLLPRRRQRSAQRRADASHRPASRGNGCRAGRLHRPTATPPAHAAQGGLHSATAAAGAARCPVPATGPQGNLPRKPCFRPPPTQRRTTAGAIQTYNWAKDIVESPNDTTARAP